MTRPSFTMILDRVLARTDVSATAKLAYAVIVDVMKDGQARIGVRRIARRIGGSRTTVADAVNVIESVGLLIVERGRSGQRACYRLPKAAQKPDAFRKPPKSKASDARTQAYQKPDASVPETGHVPDQTYSRLRGAPLRGTTSTKKKPDPRVHEFRKLWADIYRQTQRKPFINNTPRKDSTLIRNMLANLDRDRPEANALELLNTAADRLCQGGLKWANGSPTIGLLSTGLNDLLPELPGPTESHYVVSLLIDKFCNPVIADTIARAVDDGKLEVGRLMCALQARDDDEFDEFVADIGMTDEIGLNEAPDCGYKVATGR